MNFPNALCTFYVMTPELRVNTFFIYVLDCSYIFLANPLHILHMFLIGSDVKIWPQAGRSTPVHLHVQMCKMCKGHVVDSNGVGRIG